MSSMFHIATEAELAKSAQPLPQPDHCSCTVDGPRRNVLVDIDEGAVQAIACASCEKPIDLPDDYNLGVHGEGIALVMTTTVEHTPSSPDDWNEYDKEFYELAAHEDGASA